MDPTLPVLVLARAIHLAALSVGFGSLVARCVLAPSPHVSDQARGSLTRLASACVAAGLLTLLPWMVLQSAAIAEVDIGFGLPGATVLVLSQTWFGHIVLARAGMLAMALLLCRTGWPILAILPAGLALMSEAMIGHAVNGGIAILAVEALHLLAAGAWLGSLPALLILLRGPDAMFAAQRFSGFGMAAVAAVAGTALALASVQVGGAGGLFGTEYGAVVLLKLALFVALLVLASLNRLVLTPRLVATGPGMLRVSVVMEIGLGLCILGAAAWLASLLPGAHQQPIWPYAWRPSLTIFGYVAIAPELVAEPVLAIVAILIAWALLGFALISRRLRPVAFLVAVLVPILAVPHLSALLVPAYPTSFYRSPTGGDPAAVAAGRALFATHCVACHGLEGRGDGPLARSQMPPPADLTAEHLLEHADGELFWWLGHGIDLPPGDLPSASDGAPRQSMPGFGAVLDERSIWELIDFIRANNPYFAATIHNRASWGAPHVHAH